MYFGDYSVCCSVYCDGDTRILTESSSISKIYQIFQHVRVFRRLIGLDLRVRTSQKHAQSIDLDEKIWILKNPMEKFDRSSEKSCQGFFL